MGPVPHTGLEIFGSLLNLPNIYGGQLFWSFLSLRFYCSGLVDIFWNNPPASILPIHSEFESILVLKIHPSSYFLSSVKREEPLSSKGFEHCNCSLKKRSRILFNFSQCLEKSVTLSLTHLRGEQFRGEVLKRSSADNSWQFPRRFTSSRRGV